jgi:hypothetical protein
MYTHFELSASTQGITALIELFMRASLELNPPPPSSGHGAEDKVPSSWIQLMHWTSHSRGLDRLVPLCSSMPWSSWYWVHKRLCSQVKPVYHIMTTSGRATAMDAVRAVAPNFAESFGGGALLPPSKAPPLGPGGARDSPVSIGESGVPGP